MPSLPLALYTEKSNKGGVVRAQLAGFLRERKWARPWPHAEGMAGQPCPQTKLKYLAVTVMTAASTVLAKSVRFLVQGVVPVSRVSCRYPGPRESVHIQLLVSPVSFSHNNVRLLMVYSPYGMHAREG